MSKRVNKNGSTKSYQGKTSTSKRQATKGSNRTRPISSDDREFSKAESKAAENDASWYTRNSALVADSGKIAFSWPSGVPVSLNYEPGSVLSSVEPSVRVTINDLDSENRFVTPGIMALKYVPTYGARFDGYDPLNIAAQNIYTYVRHANSGHANYDPTDLMLYLMAMDQIYTLWMHLVRAYGSIRLFSQVNRNYPRVLLNAMGFDYDDISKNLANFRYYINNAAVRIGAMVVPNVMPLFARHAWMPSMVFSDSPSLKGQLYMFRPITFGKYNEKDSEEGGFLETKTFDNVHTVDEWCTLLDDLISAVRSSEDCGIMSGDILKAYGSNVMKLMPIAEGFQTNVAFSPEVLGQIANTTIIPNPVYEFVPGTQTEQTMMMYQNLDKNILESGLKFHIPVSNQGSGVNLAAKQRAQGALAALYKAKHIMVGLSESPTPEEVLVNSRLMVFCNTATTVGDTTIILSPDSCGAEIVVEAALFDTYHFEKLASSSSPRMHFSRYLYYADFILREQDASSYNIAQHSAHALARLATLNFFNLHPAHWTISAASDMDTVVDVHFDVDNYAIIAAHDVEKMHETALLSMLDVPLMGYSK